MIWFVILGAVMLLAVPLAILWGLLQLDDFKVDELDWSDDE